MYKYQFVSIVLNFIDNAKIIYQCQTLSAKTSLYTKLEISLNTQKSLVNTKFSNYPVPVGLNHFKLYLLGKKHKSMPNITVNHYTNMPCQCGYPDGMSPRGRMVFPRAEPEGNSSSQGETFHQDTHTGMAYLFYYTEQTPIS